MQSAVVYSDINKTFKHLNVKVVAFLSSPRSTKTNMQSVEEELSFGALTWSAPRLADHSPGLQPLYI